MSPYCASGVTPSKTPLSDSSCTVPSARRGDELFGAQRLVAALEACASRKASEIVRSLLEAVQEFTDQPLDDLTVVCLKQLTVPVRTANATLQKSLNWRTAPADVTG